MRGSNEDKESENAMTHHRISCASMVALGVLMLCALPAFAQDNNSTPQMTVRHAAGFSISPPLSELVKLPRQPMWGFHEANPVHYVNFHPGRKPEPVADSVEQSSPGGPASINIGLNLLGVGNGFPGYSVPDAPPDTNAAVGDTEVVEWVNVSYAIFNKTTGATLAGPVEGNTIWSNLGGICANNNDGDIIAQWDRTAKRWLLAQNVFTHPYTACIAVSQTDNALGAYYLYAFSLGTGFPDYPKYGVWPSGYFETMNNFGTSGSQLVGAEVCAYNNAKLLVGDQSAEQICFQLTPNDYSLLPGDQDSNIAPPNGQDEFLIGSYDVDGSNDHLYLYSMHPDYANPSQSTFTGSGLADPFTVPAYNPYDPGCNPIRGACIPEPNGSGVGSLADRLMYRFAYWDDGPLANVPPSPPKPAPAQHWFVNWDVTASGGQGGVRWMEVTGPIKQVNLPGSLSSINVFQQGTYAPDGNWRWMGSLTRDKVGDILLGYSVSCGSSCPGGTNGGVYPSVYIAGRQVNDPLGLGNLEAETQVVGGAGSQPDTANRWGDYSAMRIDTNDGHNGCTFWYTQEFYEVTQTFDWSTQIASAQFSNCN